MSAFCWVQVFCLTALLSKFLVRHNLRKQNRKLWTINGCFKCLQVAKYVWQLLLTCYFKWSLELFLPSIGVQQVMTNSSWSSLSSDNFGSFLEEGRFCGSARSPMVDGQHGWSEIGRHYTTWLILQIWSLAWSSMVMLNFFFISYLFLSSQTSLN